MHSRCHGDFSTIQRSGVYDHDSRAYDSSTTIRSARFHFIGFHSWLSILLKIPKRGIRSISTNPRFYFPSGTYYSATRRYWRTIYSVFFSFLQIHPFGFLLRFIRLHFLFQQFLAIIPYNGTQEHSHQSYDAIIFYSTSFLLGFLIFSFLRWNTLV